MSHKFQDETAERLYNLTLSSFQDEDLGEAETFGWFAFFRKERAILQIDSFGFVGVKVYDTPEEVQEAWFKLSSDWAEQDWEEWTF